MATILLVDEDPLHASVRKAILERKYSNVRRVGDAAEALCLMEQESFVRDLMLVVTSDQVPGIGLASFISELEIRVPDVPILVIGTSANVDPGLSQYGVRFLKRPVTADDMLSAVSRLLSLWLPGQLKTA